MHNCPIVNFSNDGTNSISFQLVCVCVCVCVCVIGEDDSETRQQGQVGKEAALQGAQRPSCERAGGEREENRGGREGGRQESE